MNAAATLATQPSTVSTTTELSELEQAFPRIATLLTEKWKTSPIDRYVESLLVNDRESRQGFPYEVVNEIMMLDGVLWQLSEERKQEYATLRNPAFSF